MSQLWRLSRKVGIVDYCTGAGSPMMGGGKNRCKPRAIGIGETSG